MNVIYDEIWMQLLMIVQCHVYSVRANLVFYKNKQQGRNLFIKNPNYFQTQNKLWT
jgi:hypothetical protein